MFLWFLGVYYFGDVGIKTKTAIAASLSMQGITFCIAWGLILWSMHDREKREKEHERFLHEIK